MLNASGKARITHGDQGRLTIHYHEDDRPAAIAWMKEHCPKGSRLIFITSGSYRADVYRIAQDDDGPRLDYITKVCASIIDKTAREGFKAGNGIPYYPGAWDIACQIGALVHGDPKAYTSQLIG